MYVKNTSIRLVQIIQRRSWSGRRFAPFWSTTDDNIIQITKLVLENRHSSVRELARELSIDKMTVHNILTKVFVYETRRRKTRSKRAEFFVKRASKTDQKLNKYHRTTAVFTWLSSVRLFSIPKTQNASTWNAFRVHWSHQNKFATRTEGHTFGGLWAVHGRVGSPISKLYCYFSAPYNLINFNLNLAQFFFGDGLHEF